MGEVSLVSKIILTLGHVLCACIGLFLQFIIKIINKIGRTLVSVTESLTGASNDRLLFPVERCLTEPVYKVDDKDIVDERATLQASTFSIPEHQLIAKCQEVLRTTFGCKKPELLAEDFLFVFPIVGPLKKARFIEVYGGFGRESAFTGSPNYYNFHVDPLEPNRVWFQSRGKYKHTGELKFGSKIIKPTGKVVCSPVQMLSMSFNDAGQCYKLTGGYSVDKTVGNTGGLGGLFGIMHGLGHTLPFPEGEPWTPSLGFDAFVRVPVIQKLWQSQ